VVAPLANPLDTSVVHPLSFAIGGLKVDGVADLRWVDEQHLAYVAQRVDYPRPCSGCKPDTVRTGVGIGLADLSGATPTFSLVGGPRPVTSLAIDATGAFVYTLGGDARVYRESPAGAPPTVLFDFGSEGNAQKIDLVADLLAAVVGGGVLHVVDVATQTTLFRSSPATTFPPPVPIDNLFSQPILVSATQVVVVGLPFAVISRPTGGADTTLAGSSDLWLVQFRP